MSHTGTDADVAHAISAALELLFDRSVAVNYSTRTQGEGAIKPGADWFKWINTQVATGDGTLILLTPASVQKPWVLWEAGAVFSAATAKGDAALERVRPVLFGIESADVPDPLAKSRQQYVRGDDPDSVRQLLRALVPELVPADQIMDVASRQEAAVTRWIDGTREAMRLAPLLPTEPVVQEWMLRMDELARSGRAHEVSTLHQWMTVAFGRQRDKAERPLDVRLHRRLGDLYAASRDHQAAAAQYRLAHKLAPRDIYTLRFLGKALLDCKALDEAERVIADIDKLDPGAAADNVQCAALKGRWLVALERFEAARDVYQTALDHNSSSYYLADLLGQVQLRLGEIEPARATYAQAQRIIRDLDENSLWSNATAATAAIVRGEDDALDHLDAVRALGPTPGDLESIERGLDTLHERLGASDADLVEWKAHLRAPRG
nr:toll/interleukin-1 receptor domain-containing protein [Solirubrobacter pauli]